MDRESLKVRFSLFSFQKASENLEEKKNFSKINRLSLLKKSKSELLKLEVSDLSYKVDEAIEVTNLIKKENPAQAMALITQIKVMLEEISTDVAFATVMGSKKNESLNFRSPIIQQALTKMKLEKAYPNNEDLFIDISNSGHALIMKNLTQLRLNLKKTRVTSSFTLKTTQLRQCTLANPWSGLFTLFSKLPKYSNL